MWKKENDTRHGILLSINYNKFAHIEVEKKINDVGIGIYEIRFQVKKYIETSVSSVSLDVIQDVLEDAKEMIEELYEDYKDMDEEDIEDWIDEFQDVINDY